MTDYKKVPVHYMLSAMKRYVEHGISPGGFLTAVLENDLCKAAGAADSRNSKSLAEWVRFCYNELPMSIWGSPEKVQAHIDACAHLRAYANAAEELQISGSDDCVVKRGE